MKTFFQSLPALVFSLLFFPQLSLAQANQSWLLYYNIEVEGKQAVIKWASAPDTTCAYFQIEKTHDQRIFQIIGQVEAMYTKQEFHLYELSDDDTREGQRLHYRIKKVDKQGQPSYSPLKTVIVGKILPVFKLMPNPASEKLAIYFPPLTGEWRYLRILDQAGNQVYQEAFHPESAATLHISLANWPRGVYLCQLQSETYSVYRKLMVQ